MKYTAKIALVECIVWTLVYAQFGLGLSGAGNVLVAGSWFLFIASCLLFTAPIQEALRELPSAMVMTFIDRTSDLGVTGVLIWHGWWWTGTAFGLHAFLSMSARTMAAAQRPNARVQPPDTQSEAAGIGSAGTTCWGRL